MRTGGLVELRFAPDPVAEDERLWIASVRADSP
jgi:hypothetical protein